MPLEGCKLFFDFHKNIVDAREIDLGGLELGLGQTLLGFKLGNSSGFFDDRPAVRRLGAQNLSNAPLFDDGVGIGSEADAHKQFLNVAQSSGAAIDEIFALAGAIEPAANDDFAGARPCRRFLSHSRLPGGLIIRHSGRPALRLYGERLCRLCRIGEGGPALGCVGGSLGGNSSGFRLAEHAAGRLRQYGIDERQRDLCQTHGRPLRRAVKDAVSHSFRAKQFMALLSKYPGNGINDVRFAASVWPDNAAQTGAAKRQVGLLTKGLKSNQFDFAEFEQVLPYLPPRFAKARPLRRIRVRIPREEGAGDKNSGGSLSSGPAVRRLDRRLQAAPYHMIL